MPLLAINKDIQLIEIEYTTRWQDKHVLIDVSDDRQLIEIEYTTRWQDKHVLIDISGLVVACVLDDIHIYDMFCVIY